MWESIRRSLARWSQQQQTNATIVDGNDGQFFALGINSSSGTLGRRSVFISDCAVEKGGVSIELNTRTGLSLFTTAINLVNTAQIISVGAGLVGFFSSSVVVQALEGQENQLLITLTIPDGANSIVIRGFGWDYHR